MCPNHFFIPLMRKCKSCYHSFGVKHLVLLFFYLWYLILGAVMFYALENDNVNYLTMLWQVTLNAERSTFVRFDLMPLIFNNTNYLQFINEERTKAISAVIERQLITYERRLGVEFKMVGPLKEWKFEHALLYSISLCTTVGYSLIHPLTTGGRIMSIVYSLGGIPFTMVLVRDWSRLVAKLLNYPGVLISKCWDAFRFCTLKSVASMDELKSLRGDRFILNDIVLSIPTSVATFALLGWIVAGAFAFCAWEPAWTVLESVLFCFNSLTTVGQIGNAVPREPRRLLLMMIYVYAGLAIVSLFIDLIYAKLSLAYKPTKFIARRRILSEDDTMPGTRSSFDNESVDRGVDKDVDLGSCVTLGILRLDGRAHKSESILYGDQQECVSKSVQTRVTVSEKQVQLAAVSEDNGLSYHHMIVPTDSYHDHRSHDDVTRLLAETTTQRIL